jgi:hypothetical protein
MTAVFQTNDPFVNDSGAPDLAEYKKLFGFRNIAKELGKIIGEETESNIRQERALYLLNNPKFLDIKTIASILYTQYKDVEKCRKWLISGRAEWFGQSPLDLIKVGRTDFVADYLKQATHPLGMTFGG